MNTCKRFIIQIRNRIQMFLTIRAVSKALKSIEFARYRCEKLESLIPRNEILGKELEKLYFEVGIFRLYYRLGKLSEKEEEFFREVAVDIRKKEEEEEREQERLWEERKGIQEH